MLQLVERTPDSREETASQGHPRATTTDEMEGLGLRRKAYDLNEAMAEQTLEIHLLNKSMTVDEGGETWSILHPKS